MSSGTQMRGEDHALHALSQAIGATIITSPTRAVGVIPIYRSQGWPAYRHREAVHGSDFAKIFENFGLLKPTKLQDAFSMAEAPGTVDLPGARPKTSAAAHCGFGSVGPRERPDPRVS